MVVNSFNSRSHCYGLILTDCNMPIMSGFEASNRIREFCRIKNLHQPMIVACTGQIDDESVKKAWQNQMDEVMPKPTKMEAMKELLSEIIEVQDEEQDKV